MDKAMYKIMYNTHNGMLRRCYNQKFKHYKHYGGRGITVCDRWKNSFYDFVEDMGLRPSKEYSLDRIDNSGNYEPSNCKWATKKEQMRNKRTSISISYNGVTKNLAQWCEDLGLPYRRTLDKIKEGNFAGDVFEDINKRKTKILMDKHTGIFYEGLKEASDLLNIKYQKLAHLLTQNPEKTNLIYV